MQKLKGWKTITINALIALLGVAEMVDFVHLFGNDTAGVVAAVLGAVNILLRSLTTTPIFKAE